VYKKLISSFFTQKRTDIRNYHGCLWIFHSFHNLLSHTGVILFLVIVQISQMNQQGETIIGTVHGSHTVHKSSADHRYHFPEILFVILTFNDIVPLQILSVRFCRCNFQIYRITAAM